MQKIIEVKNGVTRHPDHRLVNPIDFTMYDDEQIAIVGANGAGKTMFVETITGKWPLLYANKVKYDFSPSTSPLVSDNLKYIAFRDAYGDAVTNYYYQQRWNSQDLEGMSVVRDQLPKATDLEFKKEIFNLFHIDEMLDKPIILLSSGELRKFQLTKMLLNHPRVIIMDNPFIGLDAQTRDQLKELIDKLIHYSNLQVILVLSKTDDIPSFITHVVSIHDRFMDEKIPVDKYMKQYRQIPTHILSKEKEQMILDLPYATHLYHTEHIIDLNKVSIRYGERTILKEIGWTVKCGEKWALRGENGSGKSTLLSLICADNPQSYACDIALFDRKRGTGESIWEIKKHIGYVSPEMYRAYLKNLPTVDIVASGLHDSVGLYKKTLPEEKIICEWWMNIFGIGDLADRNYLNLSSGEQRLALLARAFVKDPELLILDEPLHGLDLVNCQLVKDIIEAFCRRKDKSMIMVTHYEEELPPCIGHMKFLKKNM